jgi:hypothetical protein
MPSDFDSDYAYTLGGAAALLALNGHNGYMAVASDLSQPCENWRVGGVPFTAMLSVPPLSPHETFFPRPAILPNVVDLEGGAFKSWSDVRSACARDELYENPGPIQLSGPSASRVSMSITSRHSYLNELSKLQKHLAHVTERCRPGCDPKQVRIAGRSLATLNDILDELSGPLAATPSGERLSKYQKTSA